MNEYYLSYLKATKKSENTIKNYTKYINKFLNFANKKDEDITYLDIISYQSSIDNLSSNSIRLQLASIKSYFRFLESAGIIENNPSEKIEKPEAHPKEKIAMSGEDVEKLIANAKTLRDIAIVKFLVSTGVRVSEMLSITLEQFYNAVNTNREIIVTGKGDKERTIYISEKLEENIMPYLNSRCDNCCYLFASHNGKELDPKSFNRSLKTMAKNAGLPYWKDISCHWLRSAFATIANNKGIDVATISKAMGHSSITTTTIYIKTQQSDINNAMASMSL